MANINDKLNGCLWGAIVGDALGAPYEFKERGSYNPTKKYNQGGNFNLAPGEWTDDTSMSLCAMASLTQNKKFDEHDLMTKWHDWYSKGYMSSRDICFDIGSTTAKSLSLYQRTQSLEYGFSHERFSGNGGIMRFAPIAVFISHDQESDSKKIKKTLENIIQLAGHIFDDIFAVDEWSDFIPNWTENEYEGDLLHYKITRENISLSIQAEEILKKGSLV
jgi:ADP-ribosyl-[dinitrogen reductase] hydrolase